MKSWTALECFWVSFKHLSNRNIQNENKRKMWNCCCTLALWNGHKSIPKVTLFSFCCEEAGWLLCRLHNYPERFWRELSKYETWIENECCIDVFLYHRSLPSPSGILDTNVLVFLCLKQGDGAEKQGIWEEDWPKGKVSFASVLIHDYDFPCALGIDDSWSPREKENRMKGTHRTLEMC